MNHPDMEGGKDFVEQAVISPMSIWLSGKHPDVRIYYGVGPSPGLLVAVKADTKKGLVLTAHLARKETGVKQEWP